MEFVEKCNEIAFSAIHKNLQKNGMPAISKMLPDQKTTVKNAGFLKNAAYILGRCRQNKRATRSFIQIQKNEI